MSPKFSLRFQPEKQDRFVGATEKTAIHSVMMKGIPYDLSNDNEFAALLEDLLNSRLQERPEALQYAGGRIRRG
jgi:hypothetical protein